MDSPPRVLEFLNTCGRGEFNGCEERIRPFLDDTLECWSESIMLQKIAQGSQRRRIKEGEILPLLLHALVMPPCSDSNRKCSLSGGETAFSGPVTTRGHN